MNGVSNKIKHKGLLQVYGTIPFQQFYYQGGESDADTIKQLVESMRFNHNWDLAWHDDQIVKQLINNENHKQ
jgi:hypothetical protein